MSGIIRPDYQAGAGRVQSTGSMLIRAGILLNTTRTGAGVYEITTSGADNEEYVWDVTPESSVLQSVSAILEPVSDTIMRVRTLVNGSLSDCAFYVNVNRVRNIIL